MTQKEMTAIRIPTETDAEAYKSVRLEGLKQYPRAFGMAFTEESAQPLEYFSARLKRNTVFGGFEQSELLGIVSFSIRQNEKEQHKGSLSGMYVRGNARGTGLAKALVRTLLSHAQGKVDLVQLSAAVSNEKALRLYLGCGFEIYGTEPRSLKVSGEYLDEALMHISLTEKNGK